MVRLDVIHIICMNIVVECSVIIAGKHVSYFGKINSENNISHPYHLLAQKQKDIACRIIGINKTTEYK